MLTLFNPGYTPYLKKKTIHSNNGSNEVIGNLPRQLDEQEKEKKNSEDSLVNQKIFQLEGLEFGI